MTLTRLLDKRLGPILLVHLQRKQLYHFLFLAPLSICGSSAGASYNLDTVGQGPTALAVGAGGGCLDILSHLSFLSSFSLSLGDGLI